MNITELQAYAVEMHAPLPAPDRAETVLPINGKRGETLRAPIVTRCDFEVRRLWRAILRFRCESRVRLLVSKFD